MALWLLGLMSEDNHIGPDLFHLFIDKKLYQQYADKFMDRTQIDEVNDSEIPCYLI